MYKGMIFWEGKIWTRDWRHSVYLRFCNFLKTLFNTMILFFQISLYLFDQVSLTNYDFSVSDGSLLLLIFCDQ